MSCIAEACIVSATPQPHVRPPASFIRVQGGVFADPDCREFTFSGYNAWV